MGNPFSFQVPTMIESPKRPPLDLRAELHTVADKASSLYRRQLKTRGITFGVC